MMLLLLLLALALQSCRAHIMVSLDGYHISGNLSVTGSVSAPSLDITGSQPLHSYYGGPVSGTSAAAPVFRAFTAPRVFLFVTNGTYTASVNPAPLYLRVRLVGGGGGGAGSGEINAQPPNAGAGGSSSFGGTIVVAAGGQGGGGGIGGSGGTVSISSPASGVTWAGGDGAPANFGAVTVNTHGGIPSGGNGGSSAFGGGGGGGAYFGHSPQPGRPNTGAGGGGASSFADGSTTFRLANAGSGGGAGGAADVLIGPPLALSYSYVVGRGGAAGAPVASVPSTVTVYPGAAGGNGFVEVTEYFQ